MSTPTISRSSHSSYDAQPWTAAAGPILPAAANEAPIPTGDALLPEHHLPADQMDSDTHRILVGGDSTSVAAIDATSPSRLPLLRDTSSDSGHTAHGTHHQSAAAGFSLADPFLALAADIVDDAETNRIANENRLRQLTRTAVDSDGRDRGFGLDESHPDVARLATLVDMLAAVEHQATLNLNRKMRAHPLGPWCKAQKGIGEKQAARLLAVVGDPYFNDSLNRPRLVSELWSYCGHGDPTRRMRKGMTQADLFACGSPIAKSRLWLISTACLKAQGPFADVYYARKTATEGRLHAADCKRCGPSGHPALTGSPWSDGHRHADALRIVGKTILHDLWAEARRIHEQEES